MFLSRELKEAAIVRPFMCRSSEPQPERTLHGCPVITWGTRYGSAETRSDCRTARVFEQPAETRVALVLLAEVSRLTVLHSGEFWGSFRGKR